MKPSVSIINYGLGNLSSVGNALASLGVGFEIAETPSTLDEATHLILPGVGAFKEGMQGLIQGGWIEPLRRQVVEQKKPILGICLGMQLFAEKGFEHGEHAGLGFLRGKVERIPTPHGLPLPHIGWNSVRLVEGKRIVQGLRQNPDFYFVHSYQFIPEDSTTVAGEVEYGGPIVALVESGNIFGTQFHPEKSAEAGLLVLKNFVGLA